MIFKQGKEYANHSQSIWTQFLNPSYKEEYKEFKDYIKKQLEGEMNEIVVALMESNNKFTEEAAKRGAICLMMEQMLALQYQYDKEAQIAMTTALFSDLPGVKEKMKM